MRDKEKWAYMEALDERAKTLTPAQSLAFGLLCIERMMPAYVRASTGRDWSGADILRKTLDAAWDALGNGKQPEPGSSDACSAAIPPESSLVDFAASVAFHIANAVCHFLGTAETGHPDSVSYAAIRGLETIERIEDEPSVSPAIPDRLLRAEMRRQEADFARVREADGIKSALDSPRGEKAESVLGDVWL